MQGLTDAVSRLVFQGVDGIIIAAPLQDAAEQISKITARIPTVNTDGSSGMGDGHGGRGPGLGRGPGHQTPAGTGAQDRLACGRPREWSDAASRLTSWRRTLQEAGREVPPELHGDWSPESGYRNGLILGPHARGHGHLGGQR